MNRLSPGGGATGESGAGLPLGGSVGVDGMGAHAGVLPVAVAGPSGGSLGAGSGNA